MPRQLATTVENSFVNGLVTQASGLNFPEKACTETDNCIFNELGKVSRRLGIDFENDFRLRNVDTAQKAITTYLWRNVADDAKRTFLVVQIGGVLYFYDIQGEEAISANFVDAINLEPYKTGGNNAYQNRECQYSNGHGVLFIHNNRIEPIYIEYNAEEDRVEATVIDIRIRDFEGVDDGLEIEEEPDTLSSLHKYNLKNQGWYFTVNGHIIGEGPVGGAPHYEAWKTFFNVYPANNNIWWLWKETNDNFQPRVRQVNSGDVTGQKKEIALGNARAANGHYILNAFSGSRSEAADIGGLPFVSTGSERFATGAFFAGRVWYSGLQKQEFKGSIYFSQVIETEDQFGKCYQENDPTSEIQFDLLPTDGGVIDISDAGLIYKLFPLQTSLIVFAENGIWAISGSEGLGFRATDYSVSKVSEISTISPSSFVSVLGFPVWWNYDGIYTLEPTETGRLMPKSLTNTTIKDFYKEISNDAKRYVRGAYNSIDNTIQWVFRSGQVNTVTQRYAYNRMLNLNLNTGAFYPWSIVDDEPRISGIFFHEDISPSFMLDNVVTILGDQVVDGDGEDVVTRAEVPVSMPNRHVFNYVTIFERDGDERLTFSYEFDENYVDWASADTGSVDYESSFTTGFKLHGNALMKFQIEWLVLYFDNTVTNQFDFSAIWDYATAQSTGQWGNVQRITNLVNHHTYTNRRLRVRGQGKTLQFRVVSVPGVGFGIIGWAAMESMNRMP